jgi:DNA-binding transcriptional MocR family regulator
VCFALILYFADGGGERNLRLAFSFVLPDEIERGVAILAQAIGEMMEQGI